MTNKDGLVEDENPITSIYLLCDPEETGWALGDRVKRIEAYYENGPMALLPYIRVIGPNDETIANIPAHAVLVHRNIL